VVGVTADSPATAPPADTPAATSPGAADVVRYRCAACGNLTRFDVVTTRRTRAFHHFSVGGELTVEDVEVLDESVEGVTCRWCGNGDAVEILAPGGADPS
jgi:hypothetical protein